MVLFLKDGRGWGLVCEKNGFGNVQGLVWRLCTDYFGGLAWFDVMIHHMGVGS